ncbi:MAG: AAA family ATPase [Acidimicrobiia bacterium]
MGTVVELCGLPGAGKSTIARALVARLRLDGVAAVDAMAPIGPHAGRVARLTRKAAIVGRAAAHASTWRIGLEVGLRSHQTSARDRVARPLNLVVVREALRHAVTDAEDVVHVFDQGPVQEWWSAALRADADRVLAWAATDARPQPDLLVRVDVPHEVLRDRLARRAGAQSRLETADEAALQGELVHGERLLDALCSQLVHSPGTRRPRIIRVDGLDPAAAVIVGEALARLR